MTCPSCEQIKRSCSYLWFTCSLCDAIYWRGLFSGSWNIQVAGKPVSDEVRAAYRLAGRIEALKVRENE